MDEIAIPMTYEAAMRLEAEPELEEIETTAPVLELPRTPTPVAPSSRLSIRSLRELAEEVELRGPRRFLVQGLWGESLAAMLAAAYKTGKSLTVDDLIVSVASGSAFYGYFPTQQGRVLLLPAEGDDGERLQRLQAICQQRGVKLADVWDQIDVGKRAPSLKRERDRQEVLEQVAQGGHALVVVDPMYRAVEGADKGDLYGMGALLGSLSEPLHEMGAALLSVFHTNRSGKTRAIDRAVGAGPTEHARVLLGLDMIAKRVVGPQRREHAELQLEVRGEQVADITYLIRRTVWREDPDDLSTALHYEVEVGGVVGEADDDGLHDGQRRLLDALSGDWSSYEQIGDRMKADDTARKPLRLETMKRYLTKLAESGWVEHDGATGTTPRRWRRADVPAQTALGE